MTIDTICEKYGVEKKKTAGRSIARVGKDGSFKVFETVSKAAHEIAMENPKKLEATIRKRINYVALHNPSEMAYGYYWNFPKQ